MEFDYELPERWKWVPLGELAATSGRAIVSGPFGSNIGSKFFVNDGIPVIRGNNLTTGHGKFVDAGFVFVTPEKAKELGNVDAIRDDIIFTAAGSLGQVGIIPERTRYSLYIISNKQMRVRLNRDVIDPLFAFQWLSSSAMVEFIRRQNTGSSVPLINLSIVRRLPVPLPPLAEQKRIAHILGTLDDKIELNRRMNATLEAMARALFQSWFVDFDPVRAKAAGQTPAGLDPVTAELFPAKFEDSQLGEIPKGWSVGTLGNVAKLLGGFAFKSKDWVESGVPVVKIGSVKPGVVDLDQVSFVSETTAGEASRYRLRVGDLLIGMTGYVGEVGLVPPAPVMPLLNQRVSKFVLDKAGTECLGFVYCLTRRSEFKAAVIAKSHGTAQANVSGDGILSVPIIVPPKPVRDQFNATMMPALQKILANHGQSRTLAALRDALLPELLSGRTTADVARALEGSTRCQ